MTIFDSTRNLNIRYALLQAVSWGAYCSLMAFATLFLLRLGFSNSSVGLLIALSNILGVIAQPRAAALARRLGTSRLIALLTGIDALLGICMLLFGHIPFAAALLLMPMIALLLSAQGPINALCMEYVNRGFKVNYGLGRGLGSLGYAAASYLLGNAAQRFGVSVIPMTYTVLFFTTALLALSFRLPRAAQSEPSAGEHPDPRPQPARSITGVLTHYPHFTVFLLGCVFLMMCSNSISTYMINIMTARNAASSAMGTALSLGALLELPAMAVFTLLMKRFSTCTLLRFSSVFLTAKAIAICLSTTANGIFAAQMLQPLGYALFIPATVYYTNEALAPEDRMLGQTLMMAANTLASVFGSLGGGFLLDISGTSALLFVCVGISIAGTAFTFAAGRGSTSD